MKVNSLSEPLYSLNLTVVTDCKREEFVSKYNINTSGDAAGLCQIKKGVGYIWISERSLSLFIHELIHFVIRSLASQGIKADRNNEETFSCVTEHFVKEAVKKIKFKLE